MVDFSVLGSVMINHRDRPTSISSTQVRTVCAVLAMAAGHSVSASTLVAELYGEESVGNEKNALQANMTRLRKILAKAWAPDNGPTVRTVAGGYVLSIEPGMVDAYRFLDLFETAQAELMSRPELAITRLEQGLQLWRGPALDDISGGPQVRADRARLDEKRLAAIECLAEARLALGAVGPVVADLKRMVEIHPERERFSELLMLALYRAGQQAEALVVFQTVATKLRSDLGIDPGRRLNRLHQAILSQDHILETELTPRRALV